MKDMTTSELFGLAYRTIVEPKLKKIYCFLIRVQIKRKLRDLDAIDQQRKNDWLAEIEICKDVIRLQSNLIELNRN